MHTKPYKTIFMLLVTSPMKIWPSLQPFFKLKFSFFIGNNEGMDMDFSLDSIWTLPLCILMQNIQMKSRGSQFAIHSSCSDIKRHSSSHNSVFLITEVYRSTHLKIHPTCIMRSLSTGWKVCSNNFQIQSLLPHLPRWVWTGTFLIGFGKPCSILLGRLHTKPSIWQSDVPITHSLENS